MFLKKNKFVFIIKFYIIWRADPISSFILHSIIEMSNVEKILQKYNAMMKDS